MISRLAPAKINLSLHVTGQRSDGYHLLDSLVVFTQFGDEIAVREPHHPHGPIEVMVDGPYSSTLGAGPDNLVSVAAMLLRQTLVQQGANPAPAEICLEKNLPIASGIGGGSADAAATLLALADYWKSDVDLLPIAKAIGADVPMCLLSKPLRAQGIGDEISILETPQALNFVLVNPGIEVPTPVVFKQLSVRENPKMEFADNHFPHFDQIKSYRNDLQTAAIAECPVIKDVLISLKEAGASLARMSGSGATCFGMFENPQSTDQAAVSIQEQNPTWWCVATKSIID